MSPISGHDYVIQEYFKFHLLLGSFKFPLDIISILEQQTEIIGKWQKNLDTANVTRDKLLRHCNQGFSFFHLLQTLSYTIFIVVVRNDSKKSQYYSSPSTNMLNSATPNMHQTTKVTQYSKKSQYYWVSFVLWLFLDEEFFGL